MKNNTKSFGLVTLLILFIILIAGSYAMYSIGGDPFVPHNSNSITVNSDWKRYDSGRGFEFYYPETLDSTFASFNNKMPTVISTSSTSQINSTGCYTGDPVNVGNPGYKESKVIINNIPFCKSQGGDAGAGQLYTTYYYTTLKNSTYLTIGFTVHTPNGCGVFMGTEPQYGSCMKLFENYANIVTSPIEKSISTLKFL